MVEKHPARRRLPFFKRHETREVVEPPTGREIVPPRTVMVFQFQYPNPYFHPRARFPDNIRYLQDFQVVSAGEEVPKKIPPHDYGGYGVTPLLPEPPIVTVLQPKQWTLATKETQVSIVRNHNRLIVVNKNGWGKVYPDELEEEGAPNIPWRRNRRKRLEKRGFTFVEPGSISRPPYTIIQPE